MRVSECVRECPPPHTQSILLHIPDDAKGVGSEVWCVRACGEEDICVREEDDTWMTRRALAVRCVEREVELSVEVLSSTPRIKSCN